MDSIAFELGALIALDRSRRVSTIYRVLVRHGLADVVPRRRRREEYRRWERAVPMELWQLDIVDGIRLADGSETKIVTGVDDHSPVLRGRHGGAPGNRSGGVCRVRECVARVRIPGQGACHDFCVSRR